MSGVNKEFKTIDERIALLKSRNLKFKNEDKAVIILQTYVILISLILMKNYFKTIQTIINIIYMIFILKIYFISIVLIRDCQA